MASLITVQCCRGNGCHAMPTVAATGASQIHISKCGAAEVSKSTQQFTPILSSSTFGCIRGTEAALQNSDGLSHLHRSSVCKVRGNLNCGSRRSSVAFVLEHSTSLTSNSGSSLRSAQGRNCNVSEERTSQKFSQLRLRERRGGILRQLESGDGLHIRHLTRRSSTRSDARSLQEKSEAPGSSSRVSGGSSSSSNGEGSKTSTSDRLSGTESNSASSVDDFNVRNEAEEMERSSSSKKSTTSGVFPGGFRRAEVQIPGLVLRAQVVQVLDGSVRGRDFLTALDIAVAEGVTMVILESGVEREGGARLYEAACALKELLRGRADLIVSERVDIAAAAGASGIVLSDDGLPAVVARRMMQSAASDTAELPLVARTVKSTETAKSATALEGADLLLLQIADASNLRNFVSNVCKEVSIPVFVDVSCSSPTSLRNGAADEEMEMFKAGASGIATSASKLMDKADSSNYLAAVWSAFTVAKEEKKLQQQQTEQSSVRNSQKFEETFGEDSTGMESGSSLRTVEKPSKVAVDLDTQAKVIVEAERELLTTMINFVHAASPKMQEISLLVDALRQLDELFLLVIVGEFNSGKSSVINALLGKRFLKEGVLPTTNEITLIRHSGGDSNGEERSERHPDGHILRYIPAELLKKMNLVDTPGTNVILQRQQRLTEEFVPRADLVLFVLSVDRALTESEVTFLRYIRQWGKKIIFILNKADAVTERSELNELMFFVKDNAQSLLGVENIVVYPVSARHALLAKQSVASSAGVVDKSRLARDNYWKSSGFEELEDFIYNFLEGTSDAGAERLRLKLDTPLGIGIAVLGASDRQLAADMVTTETDLEVLDQIDEQLQQYQEAIRANAALRRKRATELVTAARDRAGIFVDSVVRVTNFEAGVQYLFGSEGTKSLPVSRAFDSQVIGSAIHDVRRLLEDHGSWLLSTITRQTSKCREILRTRWPDRPSETWAGMTNRVETRAWLLDDDQEAYSEKLSQSISALDGFDVRAAEILLEQEVRQVVLGTFGRLGIAGIAGYVLTSVLPNTVDDLLALATCTIGGFLGVWSLPSRRQEVKKKINRVADSVARKLSEGMQTDLQQKLDHLVEDMKSSTTPYRARSEAERTRIIALQKELGDLNNNFRSIRQKVQNLGT